MENLNVTLYIANKIKQLREAKNITQQELAEALNTTQQSIARYESGERKTDNNILFLLADYFNISINDFFPPLKFDNATTISSDTIKIPIYASIKAGIPLESQSDIIEYMDIPKEWTKGDKKLFGIQLSGDSMFPKYDDKEVVIFEQNYDLEYCKNKDVAVMINGTESTFKKLLVNEQGIVLQPYNIAYDIIMFSNEQVKNLPITILGVAVKKVSDIKYE